MTIFSFWIFDRHCNCIYSREYPHLDPSTSNTNSNSSANSSSALTSSGTINSKDNEDTAKLLFGALFSLRNIARTLGDKQPDENNVGHRFNNELNSFTTGKYRAHFLETLSNLRLCLLSDLNTRDLKPLLKTLNQVFVDLIIRNPLAQVEFDEGDVIEDPVFVQKTDDVIRLAV